MWWLIWILVLREIPSCISTFLNVFRSGAARPRILISTQNLIRTCQCQAKEKLMRQNQYADGEYTFVQWGSFLRSDKTKWLSISLDVTHWFGYFNSLSLCFGNTAERALIFSPSVYAHDTIFGLAVECADRIRRRNWWAGPSGPRATNFFEGNVERRVIFLIGRTYSNGKFSFHATGLFRWMGFFC